MLYCCVVSYFNLLDCPYTVFCRVKHSRKSKVCQAFFFYSFSRLFPTTGHKDYVYAVKFRYMLRYCTTIRFISIARNIYLVDIDRLV